jgi:hypothetical protein
MGRVQAREKTGFSRKALCHSSSAGDVALLDFPRAGFLLLSESWFADL